MAQSPKETINQKIKKIIIKYRKQGIQYLSIQWAEVEGVVGFRAFLWLLAQEERSDHATCFYY